MSPLRRLLRLARELIDVVLFAGALLTSVPLMFWWAVMARKHILAIDLLARREAKAFSTSPEELAEQLAQIAHHTERQLFMISGESALAAVLFVVFAGALFAVAQRRRASKRDLQQLLQFSTHELKTPIAALRTLLQTIERGAIPAAEQGRFLSQGIIECNRLEHMAETILAYQHATVLRQPPLESFEAASLISEVLEHRRRTFGTDQVEWTPGPEIEIRANRDAFRVVFENVLDNARKYGQGKVQLEEVVSGRNWELRIKDRGIGFRPDEAEMLFEPFQRRNPSGMTTHGSGLGLHLARQLARSMRGDLTASSEGPGKGSTFVLVLQAMPGAKDSAHV